MAEISTKPYMLRAIHEWCTDSGLTPYIAVTVDENTQVPVDYVRAGEIVLNISAMATNRLTISNERIEFQARFNGQPQSLSIPVDNVSAIYARENGHGMAFEVASGNEADDAESTPAPRLVSSEEPEAGTADGPGSGDASSRPRPALTAVPAARPEPDPTPDNGDASDPVADASPAEPPEPDDDDPAPATTGAGRRPRGKPNLTRVK